MKTNKMKQYITVKQLNELSEEGKERLRKWWKPKDGENWMFLDEDLDTFLGEFDDNFSAWPVWWIRGSEIDLNHKKGFLPLLSIGQMIEFLKEYGSMSIGLWDEGWMLTYKATKGNIEPIEELADLLWEAVKEILNEN